MEGGGGGIPADEQSGVTSKVIETILNISGSSTSLFHS